MMKKLHLFCALALLLVAPAMMHAQSVDTIYVGEGTDNTSNFRSPTQANFRWHHAQNIYLAEELENLSCTITDIAWMAATSLESARTWRIYMGETDRETLSQTDFLQEDELTEVFHGTVSATGMQWANVELDEPFPYSGTENLAVVIIDETGEMANNVIWVSNANTQTVRQVRWCSDAAPETLTSHGTTCQTNPWLPNIRLVVQASGTDVCRRPPSAQAIDVNESSATIVWTTQDEQSSFIITLPDGTEVEQNDTSYALTDLEMNTTYTVAIRAICQNGDTSNARNVTFRTPGVSWQTIPFSCGFEDDEDISSYWVTYNNGTNDWHIGSAVANSGEKALYISNNSGADNAYTNSVLTMSYVTLPIVIDEVGTYSLTFDWRGYGEQNWDYLRVWVAQGVVEPTVNQLPNGTTGTNAYDSTAAPTGWVRAGGRLNYSNIWHTAIYEIPITNTGAHTLVFMWCNDGSGGTNPPAAIDNIYFNRLNCTTPSNLAVEDITQTSATISWPDIDDSEGYILSIDGVGQWDVDGTSYELTDLGVNTAYTVRLRSICSTGDTSNPATITFRTLCGTINQLPWHENFDTYADLFTSYTGRITGDIMPCWNFLGYNANGYISMTNSSYLYGGTGVSIFFYPGTANVGNILIFPPFEEEVSNLELSFQTRPEGESPNSGSLDVGYITNITDASTFVSVLHLDYSDFNDAFEEVFATFPDAPEGATIALRHNSAASNWYWFIDEVDVHEAPACTRPSITFSDIDTTSAVITLSDANNVNHYKMVINDGDTIELNGENTYTLTDLEPGATTYIVKALTVCEDGTETSMATNRFATLCGTVAFPFHFTQTDMMAVQNDGFSECWSYTYFYRSYSGSIGYVYSSSNGATFVTPAIDADMSGAQLRTLVAAMADGVSFRVGVQDGDDVEWLDTVQVANTGSSTTGTEYTVPLTAYTGSGNRVVVSLIGTNTIYFLDFHVEAYDPNAQPQPEVCNVPTNVHSTAVTTNSITIDWGGTASSWKVSVNNGADQAVSSHPYTITGLADGTTYSIRVKAVCADGQESSYSNAISVSTEEGQELEPCEAPTNVHSTAATTTSITLDWDGIAASWKVSVDGGADQAVSSHPHTLTGLTAGTTYSIRVKAVCTDGTESDYSNAINANTEQEQTGIDGVAYSAMSLYPNPASSAVIVGGIEVGAKVSIVDMSGRTLRTAVAEGTEIELSLQGIAAGIYLVSASGAEGTAAIRLVVR